MIGGGDRDDLEDRIEEAEAQCAATHPRPAEAPLNLSAGGYGGGPRTDEAAREEEERD